ncbi:hypothetical protein CAS87_15900, partial [Acinetobacter baumannii]
MDALYQFIETRNFSNKSLLKLLVSIGKHNSLNLEPILLRLSIGEFKHEVRQFQKPYDNQQAEQISLMV